MHDPTQTQKTTHFVQLIDAYFEEILFRRFRNRPYGYLVDIPEGWHRLNRFRDFRVVRFEDEYGAFVAIAIAPKGWTDFWKATNVDMREKEIAEFLWTTNRDHENAFLNPGPFRPATKDLNLAAAAFVASGAGMEGKLSLYHSNWEFLISYRVAMGAPPPHGSNLATLYKLVFSFRLLTSPRERIFVIGEESPYPTLRV